eukprot:TRINITY_DN465_c0_g1_i1.p1 TRINITY_DN465_c0_g1~~TRINITY_DN465_c0_g1_i1.p1  ORF type:complete len:944 (-),score=219.56 TRINITY_DN465_c0_g1_i1:200-3031(-)
MTSLSLTPPVTFLLLLALVALTSAQTPYQPLIDASQGGLYSYVDDGSSRRTWDGEQYKQINNMVVGGTNSSLVFGTMKNAVFRIDLSQPFSDSSSGVEVITDVSFANEFLDLHLDEAQGKFYALALSPEAHVITFDMDTLAFNPLRKDVAGMEDISSFSYETGHGMVVTSRDGRIAFSPSTAFDVPFVYFDDFRGGEFDSAIVEWNGINTRIHLGGDATIHSVTLNVDTSTFGSGSTYSLTNVRGTDQRIACFAKDTQYVYAIIGGTGTGDERGQAFRLDFAAVTVQQRSLPELDTNDFRVSSAIVDPKGILYLATSTNPGRIIQISLQTLANGDEAFNYEAHYEFNLRVAAGAITALAYTPYNQQLLASSTTTLIEPVLTIGSAPWACLQDCFGNGVCNERTCTCDSANFAEPWCSSPCPIGNEGLPCGGNTTSLDCTIEGTCICRDVYGGEACTVPQCPNDCSGNGQCLLNSDGTPDQCQCDEGWTGRACLQTASLPCYRYTDCGGCSATLGCGWCGSAFSSEGTCYTGTDEGPNPDYELYGNTCPNWTFQSCPSMGVFIGNSVVALLVVVMFIVNGISLVMEDGSDESLISARDQWYRMQRSSKAYAALFQIQIWAATVMLHPGISTSFLEWGRYWLYVFSGIPLIGNYEPLDTLLVADSTVPSTKRSFRQLLLFSNNTPGHLAVNLAITIGIFLVALIILYIVGAVAASAVKGGKRWSSLMVHRFIYILLRVTEFFYFPIIAIGLGAVFNDGGAAGIAIGLALLLIFGLLIPAGVTFITLKTPLSELLVGGGKYRFFAFYGQMKPAHRKHTFMPWGKKFVIGLGFALGAKFSIVIALAVAILMCIATGFVAFSQKPYADYLQRYLEIIVSVCTVLGCATLFGFMVPDLPAGGITAITIIFLVFQIASVVACLGFYFYSWMQLHGIYNLGQICGKDNDRL